MAVTPITAEEITYQHPLESVLYGADFTTLMKEEGEHIWASQAPVTSVAPAGPTITQQSVANPIAKFRVVGVTSAIDYEITVTVKTTLDDATQFNQRTMVCRLRGRAK